MKRCLLGRPHPPGGPTQTKPYNTLPRYIWNSCVWCTTCFLFSFILFVQNFTWDLMKDGLRCQHYDVSMLSLLPLIRDALPTSAQLTAHSSTQPIHRLHIHSDTEQKTHTNQPRQGKFRRPNSSYGLTRFTLHTPRYSSFFHTCEYDQLNDWNSAL